MIQWHRVDVSELLVQFGTDVDRGLSQTEVQRRLSEHGPNELVDRGPRMLRTIVWEQLTASMVVILVAAATISAALGDYKDAGAILAIVVLNTILGVTQEYRAEKAMAALKRLAVPVVKVRREGEVREISARELVPGDLVLLEAGSVVPADGRLVESANLRVQEAALTGESEPVDKHCAALPDEQLPVGDRRNMAHMGTAVTYGRGKVVVTETGMRTELGRIAEAIQSVRHDPTPLQRRLEQLGHGLVWAVLAIVGLVFVFGVLRGEDLKLLFLTAIGMAVAAIPEGLPAVVTIALAFGAQRMLKRRALIRKLPAVETLGSVTVICSDKTGTLTENRMTVTVVDVLGESVHVETLLRRGVPVLVAAGEEAHGWEKPGLALLVHAVALCNDAALQKANGGFKAIGDPTEGALVVAAAQLGLVKPELERRFPRVGETPFTSERKRMSTVHRVDGGRSPWGGESHVVFCKGAVDGMMDVATQVWAGQHAVPLDEELRDRILAANARLAKDGHRVLGVAFRPLVNLPDLPLGEVSLERDLVFVGLVGMIDPPRPEVKEAVQTCRTAGIRPVMITGDHPLTAQYIARELGIADDGRILTGQELAETTEADLQSMVEGVSVYARVSPEHKLRIVQALQSQGHIVAMTGDGVNDAPALKKADIGVAMGITGTDVAKEASDMVLLDDDFATIVAAVREGRVIYDNIRKFIKYTLSSNAGEIWTMLLAPFLGMPLPLLPLQILWVNLVTDGLPGLALGVEPAERDAMRRPPYGPQENVFGRGLGWDVLWVGLLMGLVSLAMGYWWWHLGRQTWQTIVFTTLTLAQMGNALAIRSGRDSLWRLGLGSNKPLLGAVALTFALQLAVVYVPFLQRIFRTVSLSPAELAMSLALSTLVFWAVETRKWFLRLQNS
ncbi:MAG: cation-translocating P-type ATPase [Candidatus Bipolaricaulota bacterium]